MNKQFLKKLKKSWLTNIFLLILSFAIIIATYIGINMLVQKANISDIDMTSNKIYSLSEISKSIVKDINKEVNIYLVNMNESQYVIDYAYKYKKVNEKINVIEVTDINKIAQLANEYSLDSSSQVIIIQSGEKENILTIYDLYTYDYTTYEEKDITEEAITNALIDVTMDIKPKIYFLTGHNKYSTQYMYYLTYDIEKEANEIEEIDLRTKGEVPEDCSVLVITTLKEDITSAEKDVILKYIKSGGKIMLLTDPNTGRTDMPNFQKVLDEFGVSISEGVVIEQDSSKILYGFPYSIITTAEYSSITSKLNMSMQACFIDAGKLTFVESAQQEVLGIEVENLLLAGENAFYRSNLNLTSTSKTNEDEDANSAILGALVTKTINEETQSKLVIYANNLFATNIPLNTNGDYLLAAYNNEDLILNSLSYLTEREDTITIRKDLDSVSYYNVSESQSYIVLIIIFAIPILIIVVGIIIWQIRRRKK